jgi:glycosyltransferase involved in cell wall biosynthesis
VGRFYPELDERLHQVNNGIDFEMFRYTEPGSLAAELGLDPEKQIVLLHPHRPEPGKGLPETIRVTEALVHRHGLQNLRVLVPEWIGSMVSQGELDFYHQMNQLMVDLDVRENFVFMSWIAAARMPELYSLGRATLCLGNIVEAFGNVAYESLACGTPSVVARVGVHRTLLPDELIDKVDYGDIQAAADRIAEIVHTNREVSAETLAHLQRNLDYEHQVSQYATIITQAQKRTPMAFEPVPESGDTAYQLAPWCYLRGDEVYHDFRGRFEPAGGLAKLFQDQKTVTRNYSIVEGVVSELWEDWVAKTYIIPARKV